MGQDVTCNNCGQKYDAEAGGDDHHHLEGGSDADKLADRATSSDSTAVAERSHKMTFPQ